MLQASTKVVYNQRWQKMLHQTRISFHPSKQGPQTFLPKGHKLLHNTLRVGHLT